MDVECEMRFVFGVLRDDEGYLGFLWCNVYNFNRDKVKIFLFVGEMGKVFW